MNFHYHPRLSTYFYSECTLMNLKTSDYQNKSEDTKEMQQLRSTALSRYHTQVTRGTNIDKKKKKNKKKNATYETTDTQTKMNCNTGTALTCSAGAFPWESDKFYLKKKK